jgi:putative hydrolase of the HAD superfamily
MKEVPIAKLHLLEDLRARGYRLYLLSNTNPVIMEWALSPRFSPDGKPLDAYFDKLYLSYQMQCIKPNTLIFNKMIADSGLLPSETLFLDDGAENVKTAEQLGFKTYCPANGEDFTHRSPPPRHIVHFQQDTRISATTSRIRPTPVRPALRPLNTIYLNGL